MELAKSDKNVKGYLESFVLPYNGTLAKTKDLQKYLKATGYKAPAAYYEGTKDARVFKEGSLLSVFHLTVSLEPNGRSFTRSVGYL